MLVGKIADLFVQFSAKGLEAMAQGFQTLHGRMIGLAEAGIRNSALGQVLDLRMQMLARTLGGLVGPELLRVAQGIQSVTAWIQHLSDRQKEGIAHLLEFTFATKGLRMALAGIGIGGPLGGVIAGLGGILASSKSGQDAFGRMAQALGDRLAPALDKVADAFEALDRTMAPVWDQLAKGAKDTGDWWDKAMGPMMKALRFQVGDWLRRMGVNIKGGFFDLQADAAKKGAGGRGALAPALGGPMDLDTAWLRMQQLTLQATIGAGMADPKLGVAQQQLEELKKINQRLQLARPPFAK